MIRAADRKKIYATLGKKCSTTIITYLNRKKIFNANGTSFIPASITYILRGERENLDVEIAIAELVAAEKERKKKMQKRQTRLFK
ncbi:MAG TPA: hypothetical protein VF581_07880 [Flavobacterium sp.]|jgi:hypothetical protein